MLDIGCGPGGMIEMAESIGISAWGIDGDPFVDRKKKNVTIQDYTKGFVEDLQCLECRFSTNKP
jgi:2-polyprenyl-3-methyl-5-hydroxy-6-metoxy-1,4-benzoquinol methylase